MNRTSRIGCLVALALSLGACKGGSSTETFTCSPTVLDGTCAAGQSCLGGTCVETSTMCSASNPTGVCAPLMGCLDGTCVIAATLCGPSNKTGACSAGKSCLDGACVRIEDLCSGTNPSGLCATGSLCFQGTCILESSLCSPSNPSGICLDTTKACRDGVCTTPEGACASAENLAHGQAITAAQPVIAVQGGTGKTSITADAKWKSVDGADETCAVTARFKDSNGNGTLDPYEDWTRPVSERVADLVGRLTAAQKAALLAHPTLNDVPASSPYSISATTQALVTAGVRFGMTNANAALPIARAAWANSLQTACEAAALGIPFVLSSEPMHNVANGRTKSNKFVTWPQEIALAAAGGAAAVAQFGQFAAADYKAIGVRMALSPSADLATDARWFNGQFTFGEDPATVAASVKAYVKAFQGDTLGPASVACVVNSFPGAGAAKGGWDGRLAKGKFLTYPAGKLDDHLAAFQGAFDQGVAGVMPAYGIPEAGNWTALAGAVNGSTIEQVGASFNSTLLTAVLRNHYSFTGMVLAPWGVLEDAGLSPLGAPWGKESATRAQRAAAALSAGVDQFGGLADPSVITDAVTAGLVTQAAVDAAAGRVLTLMFKLGLFENPYVDAAAADAAVSTSAEKEVAASTYGHSLVLLKNDDKPSAWLEGQHPETPGDSGDPGKAGNGSGKVLPAPPGQKYVWHGASYYVGSGFDLPYVRSVAGGGHYGELTNDEAVVGCEGAPDCTLCDGSTVEKRIACSNYFFIRIGAPAATDPDSGPMCLPRQPLSWSGNSLSTALDELAHARAAISANPGSKTQIVVAIDAARLPILDEVLAFNPAAVYVEWLAPGAEADQVFLDVVFGFEAGVGHLPAGLPLSDAAVGVSKEDLAGDAESATFTRSFGLTTTPF